MCKESISKNLSKKIELTFSGIAQKSKFDKINYTTLSYSTGGPNNLAYKVENGTAVRMDPSMNDTTAYNYSQQAAIISDEAYHGGGDVAVYAIGKLKQNKRFSLETLSVILFYHYFISKLQFFLKE